MSHPYRTVLRVQVPSPSPWCRIGLHRWVLVDVWGFGWDYECGRPRCDARKRVWDMLG